MPASAIPAGLSDGTSNTIEFLESPCFRGIVAPQPIDTVADGTSNTISFGELTIDLRDRTFDVCFSNVSRITDGTSNTILLGETPARQCYSNVAIAPDINASVPAPPALPLFGLGLAGWLARRRRHT